MGGDASRMYRTILNRPFHFVVQVAIMSKIKSSDMKARVLCRCKPEGGRALERLLLIISHLF